MDDIDRIVKGLSEAQKGIIMHLDQTGQPTQIRSGNLVAIRMYRAGLLKRHGDFSVRGRQYALTETGLAVRARLIGEI